MMQTSKRKRPATPRQGATDQRTHIVAMIRSKMISLGVEITAKKSIPGLASAHRVLSLVGQVEALSWALKQVQTMDDRARARKGGL